MCNMDSIKQSLAHVYYWNTYNSKDIPNNKKSKFEVKLLDYHKVCSKIESSFDFYDNLRFVIYPTTRIYKLEDDELWCTLQMFTNVTTNTLDIVLTLNGRRFDAIKYILEKTGQDLNNEKLITHINSGGQVSQNGLDFAIYQMKSYYYPFHRTGQKEIV